MNPIERVRAKIAAAEILGVRSHADSREIRSAWRRAAREYHPDRNGGDGQRLLRARAAYEYLNEGEDDTSMLFDTTDREAPKKIQFERTKVSRPQISSRTETMDPEDYLECVELLEARPDIAKADHVPVEVVHSGRKLEFRVSAPLEKGVNRVALPTNLIDVSIESAPMILKFVSSARGSGEIEVPVAVLEQNFHGARGVRVKFGCE